MLVENCRVYQPMVHRCWGVDPLGGHHKAGQTGGCSRSTELAIIALQRSWRQLFRWKAGRRAENGKWPGLEVTTAAPDSRAVGTAQHQSHRTIDPQCLRKSPPRRGGIFALTENVASPVHAEPRQKIWVPSWENRDLRQLLWHRHRMVQMRTRIMNQLQAVALNEGLRCKKRLWRQRGREQLESFRLAPWASRRREDLLQLLDRLNPTIADLTQVIEQEVEKCPEAGRLRTHPGVGALTALAFVLIIGRPERFQCGKQIAAYLGLVPLEDSSGNRRRLGHITKQGSSMLRFLLVEAAQVSARSIPEWRNKYFHLAMRRGRKIAKVAMARRLAIVCIGCGARDGITSS